MSAVERNGSGVVDAMFSSILDIQVDDRLIARARDLESLNWHSLNAIPIYRRISEAFPDETIPTDTGEGVYLKGVFLVGQIQSATIDRNYKLCYELHKQLQALSEQGASYFNWFEKQDNGGYKYILENILGYTNPRLAEILNASLMIEGGHKEHNPAKIRRGVDALKTLSEAGYSEAGYHLAQAYGSGRDNFERIPNPHESLKYLRISADQGNIAAALSLGKKYLYGYTPDNTPNPEEALRYLKKATVSKEALTPNRGSADYLLQYFVDQKKYKLYLDRVGLLASEEEMRELSLKYLLQNASVENFTRPSILDRAAQYCVRKVLAIVD